MTYVRAFLLGIVAASTTDNTAEMIVVAVCLCLAASLTDLINS